MNNSRYLFFAFILSPTCDIRHAAISEISKCWLKWSVLAIRNTITSAKIYFVQAEYWLPRMNGMVHWRKPTRVSGSVIVVFVIGFSHVWHNIYTYTHRIQFVIFFIYFKQVYQLYSIRNVG